MSTVNEPLYPAISSLENQLLWIIRDLVGQHCESQDDRREIFNSAFLSADAAAIRCLIEFGHMELVGESDIMPSTGERGRWVSARMVQPGKTPYAFGKRVKHD